MELIGQTDKDMLMLLSHRELQMIRSALVEVLYALDTHDCASRTGFSVDDITELLNNMNGLIYMNDLIWVKEK